MNWSEIKEKVEQNGGLQTFTMETLRDIHGAGKLGSNVCTEIKAALAGEGLGHIPTELPRYQHELVRLYKRGTSIGKAIDAVLTPGEQYDSFLIEQLATEKLNHADMIQRIRDIVAE